MFKNTIHNWFAFALVVFLVCGATLYAPLPSFAQGAEAQFDPATIVQNDSQLFLFLPIALQNGVDAGMQPMPPIDALPTPEPIDSPALIQDPASAQEIAEEERVLSLPPSDPPNDAIFDPVLDQVIENEAIRTMPWNAQTGVQAAGLGLTFRVTKVADSEDGHCDVNDCSLREAVQAAAASFDVRDQILLPAGIYRLTGGPLRLADDLQGEGAATTIIDGNANGAVLDLPDVDGSITVSGVTIQNGSQAGIRARFTHLTLTLENSVVSDNRNQGCGGGIEILSGSGDEDNGDPSLTVRNSIIRKNRAQNRVESGVVDPIGYGGGICFASISNLRVVNSSIVENQAEEAGGGMWVSRYNVDDYPAPRVVVEGTVIARNQARLAGGIQLQSANATLLNSTISENQATEDGGGLLLSEQSLNEPPLGQIFFNYVTIADNRADSDKNGSGRGGGLSVQGDRIQLALANTLVARNVGVDCVTLSDNVSVTVSIFSYDYNLIQSTTHCSITGDTSHTLLNLDAKVSVLQDNGGPTLSHLPLSGSPVIDAADPADCPAIDQRGITRPAGTRCDIGAVEASTQPPPTPTPSPTPPPPTPTLVDPGVSQVYTVSKTADSNDGICDADCSLREAATQAARSLQVDTILLPAGLYSVTLGRIELADHLIGAGAKETIIDGRGLVETEGNLLFYNNHLNRGSPNPPLNLAKVTLRNAHGPVVIFGLATQDGSLVVDNSLIEQNVITTTATSAFCSAIDVRNNALTLRNSIVRKNIGNSKGILCGRKLKLSQSIVNSNVSSNGVTIGATSANIWSSIVRDNLARHHLFATRLRITNSTIYRNSYLEESGHNGAVVEIEVNGIGVISATSIFSNTSNICTICTNSSLILTMTNSTISGNLARIALVYVGYSNAQVFIHHTTIINNVISRTVASDTNPVAALYLVSSRGVVRFANSIVAQNRVLAGENQTQIDCVNFDSHPVHSEGGNLFGTFGDCSITGQTDKDRVGVDSKLAGLAKNGGRGLTHLPLADSPVIDAGVAAFCLPTDQRGVSRVQGAGCDSGAVEAQ